jgi:hypothetical protein
LARASVSQNHAQAGGDVVAGDKRVTHHHYRAGGPSVIDQLLEKLHAEIEANVQTRKTVESLARFQKQRAPDGVVGLEAKLKKADREHELLDALEQKELFVKLLETWSLYESAQSIFAYFLAKAEYEFKFFIQPQIGQLSEIEFNQLVNDKVVAPTTTMCGGSTFTIDHSEAMGMIYWLAEQCFVRWHK